MSHHLFAVEDLSRKHCLFLIFVGIERRDALFRRTVFPVRKAALLQFVQVAVPRQKQRRSVADFQVFGRERDSLFPHVVYLKRQVFGVKRDAVSKDVYNVRSEDAGGKQMERELAVIVDDGVSRISSSPKN